MLPLGKWDPLERRANQENKALTGFLVPLAEEVRKGLLGGTEPLVLQEAKEHKGVKVIKVLRDHRVLKDRLVPQAIKVLRVIKVLQARQGQQARKDQRE